MQHEGLLRTTPPLCCYDGILFDTAILVTSGLLCMMPPPFFIRWHVLRHCHPFCCFRKKTKRLQTQCQHQRTHQSSNHTNVHTTHQSSNHINVHINHRTTSMYTSIIYASMYTFPTWTHQCTNQSSTHQCTNSPYTHVSTLGFKRHQQRNVRVRNRF